MTVKIIHVGLGGWGANWARHAIPPVSEVEVVGLVEPVDATLRTVQAELGLPDGAAFHSLTEALAGTDAQAVVITSPAVTHVPLALEALEAGKHVLVEKPFAQSIEEGLTAVRRAEELGLVLQVSQNYRNFPAPREVQKLLDDDAIGELASISIDFRKWDNDAEVGTHPHYLFPHPLLSDMAIHHFDLLRMVTGREGVSVYARVSDPPFSKYRDEASAVMVIELEGGLLVSHRGSWLSRAEPTPWSGIWSIQGEEGEIAFGSRDDMDAPDGDWVTVRRVGDEEAAPVALTPAPYHDRSAGLQIFALAIEGGPRPESTGRDNLGSLALMEAAIRSASSGRVEPVERPA